MDNNLDTSPTKGTMVANGAAAAPVAKGKITAAQIHKKCPPQLTEYGRRIAAHLNKAEKYIDKAEQHKVSAGHYLGLVLDIVDETGFDALRDRFFPDLGRSRAFELKSIAVGKKTPEQIRAATRERVARHRVRQSVTSHVTDNRLVGAIEARLADAILNVVVDEPVTYRTLFDHIAAIEDGRRPTKSGPELWPSCRISNRLIRSAFDWRPSYATYRSGLT